MLRKFARTMACISFVFAAAPSFAGFSINENNGTLHANDTFGGGNLVVSVGNFSSNVIYRNVSFQVFQCTDISGTNCFDIKIGFMGDINPGKTVRSPGTAPPGSCYFTQIFVGNDDRIDFPGYCVGR